MQLDYNENLFEKFFEERNPRKHNDHVHMTFRFWPVVEILDGNQSYTLLKACYRKGISHIVPYIRPFLRCE